MLTKYTDAWISRFLYIQLGLGLIQMLLALLSVSVPLAVLDTRNATILAFVFSTVWVLIQKSEKPILIYAPLFLIWIAIQSVVFVVLDYLEFRVPAVDFSIFDWMIPSSRWSEWMSSPVIGGKSHFSIHSTPILLLFIPFHNFFESPYFLLTLHALVISLGIAIIYFLSLKFIASKERALFFALACFYSASIGKLLMYHFHIEVFYLPFIAGLLFVLHSDKKWAFWMFLLAVLSVREDAGLILAFMLLGVLMQKEFRKERLPEFIGALCLSLIVFVLQIKWIIPSFQTEESMGRLAGGIKYGSTFGEIVWSMMSHPLDVLKDLWSAGWWGHVGKFLFSFVLNPISFFGAFPTILITSVSRNPAMHAMAVYYSVPMFAFLVYGALNPKLLVRSNLLVLGVSFVLLSVGGGTLRFPVRTDLSTSYKVLESKLDFEKTVCTQGGIFPHLPYHLESRAILLRPGFQEFEKCDQIILSTFVSGYPYEASDLKSLIELLKNNSDFVSAKFGEFELISRMIQ